MSQKKNGYSALQWAQIGLAVVVVIVALIIVFTTGDSPSSPIQSQTPRPAPTIELEGDPVEIGFNELIIWCERTFTGADFSGCENWAETMTELNPGIVETCLRQGNQDQDLMECMDESGLERFGT